MAKTLFVAGDCVYYVGTTPGTPLFALGRVLGPSVYPHRFWVEFHAVPYCLFDYDLRNAAWTRSQLLSRTKQSWENFLHEISQSSKEAASAFDRL